MRDGAMVATHDTSVLTRAEHVRLMTGREVPTNTHSVSPRVDARVALTLERIERGWRTPATA